MCGPRMGWGMIYWRGCFCGLSGIRGGAIFVGEPWRRCLAGFRGCPDWRVLTYLYYFVNNIDRLYKNIEDLD